MDLTFSFKFFSITRTITISRQWIQYLIIAAVLIVSAIVSFWGAPSIYILIVV
jgi:hypothetical protein